MGENDNLRLQQEIKTNMSAASMQPFALSNEEQAFSVQQQVRGSFNRSSRRKTGQQKIDQHRDTQEWVNKSNTDNVLQAGNAGNSAVVQGWPHTVNQEIVSSNQQNNKASSESIETLRENIKNSQETLKLRSCESLTIEEASMRSRSASSGPHGRTDSNPPENNCDQVRVIRESNSNNENNVTVTCGNVNNRKQDNEKLSEEKCRESDKTDDVKFDKNDKNLVENYKNSVSDKPKVDNGMSYQDFSTYRRASSSESTDCLNESTCDLSRSYRSLSISDPYTAAIDLSNKCRLFYFSHLKASEAIKQSVRSAKHTRAKEKMEGKPSSGIDNAMDRLRSEMADLMDQDLSLMSQLLKLNDKIEEVKTNAAYRQRQEAFSSQSTCYLSNSEMSDSEFEDNDDSRLDLSQSANNFKTQTVDKVADTKPQNEVVLRRLEPTDSQIIVYKKKKARKGKRCGSKGKISQSRPETEEDSDDESEENDGVSDSLSDTESTLSYNSGSTLNGSDQNQSEDAEQSSDVVDSGIQSQQASEEPPKPKKGGISQNRKFLSFHKENGNFTKSVLTGLNVLTLQGHNVPLDKYYVPPGLVYLKQEKSENVFCQFTK